MRDANLKHEVYRYEADMQDDEGTGSLLVWALGFLALWIAVLLGVRWVL